DDGDAAIVSSTIDLARNLGLAVVAEGIESETVWQQLRDYGCDFGQGFYLSRSLAPEQMTRWLEQRRSAHDDTEVDDTAPAALGPRSAGLAVQARPRVEPVPVRPDRDRGQGRRNQDGRARAAGERPEDRLLLRVPDRERPADAERKPEDRSGRDRRRDRAGVA